MKYTFLYTHAHFLVRQEKSHSFIYFQEINKGPSDEELVDRMGKDMDEGKEKDAKNAENILDMQTSLRDRISDSEFLPEEEKAKHLEFIKIRTLSGREIRELDAKVTKEEKWVKGARESYAEQINAAGDKVFAFDKSKKIDTKQEYFDEFNSLKSIAEIERYMEGLRAEIEEKIALWDKIMGLVEDRYPDKAKEYEDRLRTWDRTERKRQLSAMEQLEGMDDNIINYQKLLDSKDAEEHMSKTTREKYAKAFKELTPNEQEFWIREFPKWLSQYEQQTTDYNEFSEDRRKEFKGFSEKGLTGKMKIIDEMKLHMIKEFEDKVGRVPDEYMSKESKQYAIQSFKTDSRETDVSDMEDRILYLDKFVEVEAELFKDYTAVDSRLRQLPDYNKDKWTHASFEEKQKMLELLEEEEELYDSFQGKLQKAMDGKIISESTMDMYLGEIGFFNSTMILSKKKDFVNKFSENMAPREAVVSEFQQLSDETQKRDEFKKFWERGLNGRREILAKAQDFEQGFEADTAEGGVEDQTEAQMEVDETAPKKTTRKKSKTAKATDPEGKSGAVKDAEQKAKQAMMSETLKKSAKRTSRLKEISGSRKFVEGKTKTTKFEKQRAYDGSEELEDALIKHSKGKKRINADGKVEETLELDVDKLKEDNLGTNLNELDTQLDEATRHRTNKGEIIADSMKTKDRSGQEKDAQNFEDAVDDMEDDLKEEVAQRVKDTSPERSQKVPKQVSDDEPTSSLEDDIVEAIEDVVDNEIQQNEGKVA